MSNSQILIKNARIFATEEVWEAGYILVDGSQIVQMGPNEPPSAPDAQVYDATGLTALPGFVDVHVHGGMGHEAMDATPEALQEMAQFYAAHGVTSFLAATWTDSDARIMAALENAARCTGPQPGGATLLGVYLEGPYLNPKRCGAQSTEHIRRSTTDEAKRYLDTGVIRQLAVAPEFAENHWLIEECARRGITTSVAHTTATYEEVLHAVTLGLTQATHTYNAMTGLHHRDPGTVGAVLTCADIRAELIADGVHVHPAAMRILFAAKGAEGTILITDAIRGTGMPDGIYPIDTRHIVIEDGIARLPDGALAGSTLTMDRALRTFMDATGEPLETIWRTTSLNAAEALAISTQKGSLSEGKDADLVLLDDTLTPQLTVAEGVVVYQGN